MATKWGVLLTEDYEELDGLLNTVSDKLFNGRFLCNSFRSDVTSGLGFSGGAVCGETFDFAEMIVKSPENLWPEKHKHLRTELIAFLVRHGMAM